MGRNGQAVTEDTQVSRKTNSQGGGVVTARWAPKVKNPSPRSGETAGQVPSTRSTLGKQTEGPARPAQGLRSQAPGCLEPTDQGGSSGTSRGTVSRGRSPDPRPRVHSRDSQSQSDSRTTLPLDRGDSMGVPLLLEGDKKGTLTLDQGWTTQVPR